MVGALLKDWIVRLAVLISVAALAVYAWPDVDPATVATGGLRAFSEKQDLSALHVSL